MVYNRLSLTHVVPECYSDFVIKLPDLCPTLCAPSTKKRTAFLFTLCYLGFCLDIRSPFNAHDRTGSEPIKVMRDNGAASREKHLGGYTRAVYPATRMSRPLPSGAYLSPSRTCIL